MTPEVATSELRDLTPLERDFLLRWRSLELDRGLVPQYRFDPSRRWKFDFAHVETRVAIELDGEVWRGSKGAHTSGKNYQKDRERDLAATLAGWTVIRLTGPMIRGSATSNLLAIHRFIRARL